MMTMYDVIKQQWEWGCYTDPSQLDIYVQVGYITEEQKEEIVKPKEQPTEPVEDTSSDKETTK